MRISLFLMALALLVACKSVQDSGTPPAGYTAATVRDFRGLDGCSFLIVADDSTRFEADNLEAPFQKDGLRIFFTYKNRDAMSICMAGKTIHITDIKRAEK